MCGHVAIFVQYFLIPPALKMLKTEKKGVKVTISFAINFKQEKATVNRLLRESTATG